MSNVNNIPSNTHIRGIDRPDARTRPNPSPQNQGQQAPASVNGQDEVDLSPAARRLSALSANENTVRPELVDRIRNEIAGGEFLTDQKLDAAADALIDRLELDA